MRISMKLRFKCWKSQEFKPCVFFAQGLPDPQQFVEVRYLRELWSIKPLREIIEKCHEKSWSARDAEAKSMSILVVARSCWLDWHLMANWILFVFLCHRWSKAAFSQRQSLMNSAIVFCVCHVDAVTTFSLGLIYTERPPRACPWFDCRWDSHEIRWFPDLQGSHASGRLCKAGKQSRVESLFPNSQSEVEVSGYRKDWKRATKRGKYL